MNHVEDDVPKCCALGNDYISWIVDMFDSAGDWTGWGMMVDYIWEDRVYVQVNFCPFCGKNLEQI